MAPTRSHQHAALGAVMREARAARGLSQSALAERSGLHRTYYASIERGEGNPSYANLLRLAEALGLPLSALIERSEASPHSGGLSVGD